MKYVPVTPAEPPKPEPYIHVQIVEGKLFVGAFIETQKAVLRLVEILEINMQFLRAEPLAEAPEPNDK